MRSTPPNAPPVASRQAAVHARPTSAAAAAAVAATTRVTGAEPAATARCPGTASHPTRWSSWPTALPKAIKDVQFGDQVLAADPPTGATEGKMVEGLHRNQDTDLTEVTVRTKDGSDAVLHTTWFHPFWDDTQHTWIYAQDLKTGDVLHTEPFSS
ncbi:polymorphic toxin-type HINT domain-containing protein [Dactylosporangium sp. CA-052675]|uniref:polymorphic toxin-type HINT domain-containing protein n=1 Tax=Dactylosporangium sp. CA-052675 TaxID=3239927 RepID=UPI003D8F8ED6